MREGLSYDDVLLVPQRGELRKRKEADISTKIGPYKLEVPIISANMPSVTGPKMAKAMSEAGGLGVLHRFNTIEEATAEYHACTGYKKGVSLGLSDGMERAERLIGNSGKGPIFFLDVAHGHHDQVIEFIYDFKSDYPAAFLIAGNVATRSGARELMIAGADGVKVGIGPGAACITREVTGFGVPQWTAVTDVADVMEDYPKGVLIADGGIKTSGDIVKALAAGADAVMVGRILAGCDEAPDPGVYYGNASAHVNGHNAPEGVYGQIERSGSVEQVMKTLAWGIKSGVSYGGGFDLSDLRENAQWMRVSTYTAHESGARV